MPCGRIDDTFMRLLTAFILCAILFSCNRADVSKKKETKPKPLTHYPGEYIDTEHRYTDSTGIAVIIQNSIPRGGIYEPNGNNFETRIFWNRVINETDTPLELRLNFPADSFPILSSSESFLKIFLPSDTMTIDKETSYGYGARGLAAFIDSGMTKPTTLQRTISPKEGCLFYIAVLLVKASGAVRTELILKEGNLFYGIRGIDAKLDSTLISCGQIAFKN
jgi:hypothetical protein